MITKAKSIKFRIVTSCLAITAVVAALGLLGYVMFTRVSTEVGTLSQHALPTVQHSTGVERSAFECILEERNYVLDQKDTTHQKAKAKVGELMGNLDQVDKVATQFKDTALQAKAREVRKISQQWAGLYEQGVAAYQSNKVAATEFTAKGVLVVAEADAYMAAKNTEYLEAKNALAIVNRISALALETRMSEKSYMLYKEQKYFEAITQNIAALLASYAELERLRPDATEQRQITDARKATQDYFDAAKKWVEIQKTTVTAEGVMEKMYAGVMTAYNQFMDSKQKDYQAATTNDTAKASAYQMLMTGSTVADYANAAVIFSKKYTMDSKEENWKGVTDSIDQLTKNYADLRKLATLDQDRQKIDAADKATQEYLTAAKAWVESDKQLKAAAVTMNAGGDTVAAAAAAYATAKTTRTDKVAAGVFIVSDITQTALTARLNARMYMATPEAQLWAALTDGITKLNGLYADLRKVSLTTEDQQRIDRAEKATAEYLAAAKVWVQNDNTLRQTILPEMGRIGESVLATAQAAENDAWKVAGDSGTAVNGIVATAKTINMIALVVGLLVGLGVIIYIIRSIEICVTRPINAVAAMVATGTEQIVAAASQVSSASQSLAEGASEQAASLEETSSSLEEMSSMTKRNADNAQQAKHLADNTKSAAEAGSQGVQAMSQSMDAIQASSNEMRQAMGAVKDSNNEVAKIIKTIDEIAFQTNILALNAAVEAARAGEAGLGFAVVAEEVRSLAQKSAAAARETTSKIEAAIGRTEVGVRVSEKVVDDLKTVLVQSRQVEVSLKGIEQKSKEVASLVGEIAAASAEQSQGIGQVSTAMSQMDRVTQSNAASAEESASAAEELNAQAATMSDTVSELQQLVGGNQEGRGPKSEVRGQKAEVVKAQVRTHTTLPKSAGKPRPAGSGGNGGHPTEHSPAVPALASTRAGNGHDIPLAGDFKDF